MVFQRADETKIQTGGWRDTWTQQYVGETMPCHIPNLLLAAHKRINADVETGTCKFIMQK